MERENEENGESERSVVNERRRRREGGTVNRQKKREVCLNLWRETDKKLERDGEEIMEGGQRHQLKRDEKDGENKRSQVKKEKREGKRGRGSRVCPSSPLSCTCYEVEDTH